MTTKKETAQEEAITPSGTIPLTLLMTLGVSHTATRTAYSDGMTHYAQLFTL